MNGEKRGPKLDFQVTPEIIEEIRKMSGIMTQEQMHNYFGITKDVWYDRKKKHPEMDEAIRSGHSRQVRHVASKLMDHIENGNVSATIFYLKTQGRWRDHSIVEFKESEKREIPKSLGADPIEASRTYQQIMGEK